MSRLTTCLGALGLAALAAAFFCFLVSSATEPLPTTAAASSSAPISSSLVLYDAEFAIPLLVSCAFASEWKRPPSPIASSSSNVPSSTMQPLLITAILSACLMVESRWAIAMVVRLVRSMISSSAACTTRSPAVSSAEVASSSSSTAGCLMMARAMATRCFCPPESLPPP
mmetsp:Transcript_5775/g.18401  ORF Transcript_5775/g.18401 Transcript_5775/m.18401 type:complete len:170 (-) Transcript_5775:4071-4580(-)